MHVSVEPVTPTMASRTRASQRSDRTGGAHLNECAALKGSQRWLQVAVNRCRTVIDDAVAQAINLEGETIEWLSPLESDCFKEYRDEEFLERIDVCPRHRQLADFWPHRGPVWDGLARTSRGRRLLIEAKANIPEFDTSPTRATGESLYKIEKAFSETREFLKVRSSTDWTKCFYQYANRLAHLYFLKQLNGVDAALVFIYFTGDTTVPGREPVSREGWHAAIDLANHHLGVHADDPWISENVVDVFIDVDDLKHIAWP